MDTHLPFRKKRLTLTITNQKTVAYNIANEVRELLKNTQFSKYSTTMSNQIVCHFFAFGKDSWNIEIQRNQKNHYNDSCNTNDWIDDINYDIPKIGKLPSNSCIGNSCPYIVDKYDE